MGISELKESYRSKKVRVFTMEEYLEGCKSTPAFYHNAHERMLSAIGEPELVDTTKDPRLMNIFTGRTIKRYASFKDFFGMEEAIEQIVAYFRHGAQGAEERKQVLYLLGPVGGGKSSVAERLKMLIEQRPMYCIARRKTDKGGVGPVFSVDNHDYEVSPVFESPLGFFNAERDGEMLQTKYGILPRRLVTIASPWALKRLHNDFDSDISRFYVLELYPSQARQIGVMKVEPGDENNNDISTLVGKVDIRKLDQFSQSDPDAYGYAGGLNRTPQGLLELVEMFKAPIKMLHPLLTAPQDGNYQGTEGVGLMPYQGVLLAHSNEEEWQKFRNNRENEALLDRIYIVKVPYCLQYTEEVEIYRKIISRTALAEAVCAPGTYEMLAQFSVLSRLKEPENSSLFSKMRVRNGDDIKETDPKAKSVQDYRDAPEAQNEGMDGVSTRFAYKVLSATFNHDTVEVAANPVHLMYVLKQQIQRADLPSDLTKRYLHFIDGDLAPRYVKWFKEELQEAFLESFDEFGQNKCDHYVQWADIWCQDKQYKDPDTGKIVDRNALNAKLEEIEKPAGIANPKDFRNEVVQWVLRHRADNGGKNPRWTAYEKLREVIASQISSSMEDLLPVISFGPKESDEMKQKHLSFVARMKNKGYTERQIRILVEWDIEANKSK